MIEILVIIAVVRAFKKLAEKKNLSTTKWGIVGAASYYVPILLMSFLIMPMLRENGTITIGTGGSGLAVSIFINLLVGAGCCFAAYVFLKNQETQIDTRGEDILDQNI